MKHSYSIALERFSEAWPEVEPLARAHYAEMQKRFEAEGMQIGPFNPRVDAYERANRDGYMFLFVVRDETGKVVGHATVYLTSDMHNGELIAREDTIFIHPGHRNGIGRKLSAHILAFMKAKGVKRAFIDARTDPRAIRLWQRLGFKPVAEVMMINF